MAHDITIEEDEAALEAQASSLAITLASVRDRRGRDFIRRRPFGLLLDLFDARYRRRDLEAAALEAMFAAEARGADDAELNERRDALYREARHFAAVWLREHNPKEPVFQHVALGLCIVAMEYAEAQRDVDAGDLDEEDAQGRIMARSFNED